MEHATTEENRLSLTLSVWWGILWAYAGFVVIRAPAHSGTRGYRGSPIVGLIYFAVVTGLVYFWGRYLAANRGLSSANCRVPHFRLNVRGVAMAFGVPSLLIFSFTRFPGELIYNNLATGEIIAFLSELIFFYGLCSGLAEEILFRGFMQRMVERRYGRVGAIGIVTLLFIAGHFRGIQFLPGQLLAIGGIAVLLSVITLQDGHVWNAALLHGCWNVLYSHNQIISFGDSVRPDALYSYVIHIEALSGPTSWLLEHTVFFSAAVVWSVIGLLLLTAKLRGKPLLGDPLPDPRPDPSPVFDLPSC